MSVLYVVKKHKSKLRALGHVEMARREDFDGLDLDAKVELLRNLAGPDRDVARPRVARPVLTTPYVYPLSASRLRGRSTPELLDLVGSFHFRISPPGH
jgi:hypothetical protein